MQQFKVGDVVRLKSGGDNMTVESIGGEKATCVWFPAMALADTGRVMYISDLKRMSFPVGALERL